MILKNARIFGGLGGPPELFEYVLIEDGKILTVGNLQDFPHTNAEVIDLGGAWVFPGFCDAHMHMAAGGQSLGIIDLSGLDLHGVEIALLRASASKRESGDEWLEAFNWDENDNCRLNARKLEHLVSGRPVIIHKRDLHSCCLNETALKIVNVDRSTIDPDGGRIGRDSSGTLTGMLFESAIGLIHAVRKAPDELARRNFILTAQEYLVTLGLTGISEVLDRGNGAIYRNLDKTGSLKIDIDGWLRFEQWDGQSQPEAGDRFRCETIKLFLDGSFGSRTAAMNAPFLDGSDSGNLIYRDDDLFDIFQKVKSKGWRLAIHAIGDLAVEQACRVLTRLPNLGGFSGRIEHLQQLPENGVNLVRDSRALASMQSIHMLDDQTWLPSLIGAERCVNSFIWRSLADAGVPIALGSDWPVASPDPLLSLHATINRARYGEEKNPLFQAEEALLPWQAIRAVSLGYAIATDRKNERGAITPGKFADLTVVNQPDENLRDWSNANILLTISRGEKVFVSPEVNLNKKVP